MPLMNTGLNRRTRGRLSVLLFLGVLMAAGCRPAPTISVTTEKTAAHANEETMEPDMPEPTSNGNRILGAYIPGPVADGMQRWWVFKMRGGPETIGKRQADFDRFLASIRLPVANGEDPGFQLPDHWKTSSATDGISKLNIRTGHRLTPTYMTMSDVGGTLLENINRWEGQVGLPPTAEADLPKLWREMKTADGVTIYRLDLKGPGGKQNQMMKPPFAKS